MKPAKVYMTIFLGGIVTGGLLLLNATGCAKEYSFEGADTSLHDSLPAPVPVANKLPLCSICNSYSDPVNLNQWSLKAEQSKACGIIDTAIATFDRSAFTFFGPSSCSKDTGMVITVYLENEKLDRDKSNVLVNKVAFYYYDRVTPTYIYVSSSAYPFSVFIDSYNHQTKIVTGSFEGFAHRTNGINAYISGGRFKIKLL